MGQFLYARHGSRSCPQINSFQSSEQANEF